MLSIVLVYHNRVKYTFTNNTVSRCGGVLVPILEIIRNEILSSWCKE